jgi:DnaA family protein
VTQLTLDFGPPPAPDLDNFVPGRNAECLAALRTLLARLDAGEVPEPRVIYIWGPPGSGKSHLAGALAAHGARRLCVVDDCDRLDPAAQERLFHAFNRLVQSPADALVAFAAVPPARLTLLPDLVSRLGWGIVLGLAPLGDEELEQALRRAGFDRGLALGNDVIGYLLRHSRRDIATLKAILDRLDRLALERKRPVNLALLRTLLDGAAGDRPAAPAGAGGTGSGPASLR